MAQGSQQQQPDGTWAPAEPLGYQPGWDVERTSSGRWTLYRTTRRSSTEVAHGRATLGLVISYCWHRFIRRR